MKLYILETSPSLTDETGYPELASCTYDSKLLMNKEATYRTHAAMAAVQMCSYL